MDFNQASLELCRKNRGKLEVISKAPVTNRDELSTAYTPGVAEPCRKIHADKHVALVPTLGSEGTSLSLLEAMASQCAVVCTNVGGMTNIVIDGHNGIMINPDEDELYTAVLKLIKNRELRKIMSDRAYSTVKEGFSIERWEARWRTILNRS